MVQPRAYGDALGARSHTNKPLPHVWDPNASPNLRLQPQASGVNPNVRRLRHGGLQAG